MKKISLIIASVAALSLISCDKVGQWGSGTLSFSNFKVTCDDYVEVKSVSAASDDYTIFLYDAQDNQVLKTNYSAVKNNKKGISLPAGIYTLEARSCENEVSAAEFNQPVYSASTLFEIVAGETTEVESLTCTLSQCKVTVDYSDEFLKLVTGDCTVTVEVISGYPLKYEMKYSGGNVSYERNAGYFAVNEDSETIMVVTFNGKIEGKPQKTTRTFTGVAARQWRQVKFVKKVEEEGNGTFYINIDEFVDDEELSNEVPTEESIIAEDPSAPKGDGGITLELDYANGCNAGFTDLEYLVMPKYVENPMKLALKATVPNGVKKFGVKISSTNDGFVNAVKAADAESLDLLNPTEANEVIFQVVPFPHGQDLAGMTEITFDLSAAQEALNGPELCYPGIHTFEMSITDVKGCKKAIPVVMIVE